MTTTVLVTGASRGLGRAMVETFLSRPNHIVIAAVRDLNSANSTSLKKLPTADGTSIIIVKIDNAEDADAETAMETIRAAGITHLDIVISNAGIANVFSRVEGIEQDIQRKMFDINVIGTISLYKATYPFLKKTADIKGPGMPKFIGISTIAASLTNLKSNAPFLLGAYGASKVALNYLVRRAQFETEWLTAFVVNPGVVQTDMGNEGVKFFGMEQAPVTVQDSVDGIIKHIDEATREKTSGKFLSYDGEELPW